MAISVNGILVGSGGADGKSAYEIAVENGYTGTVTEWLESLKGGPGDPGSPGENGVSPTVTVTAITGGHRVTITDVTGTHTFDVMDGEQGDPGQDGAGGVTSFNGRTGAVTPGSNDYTAEMVGAVPTTRTVNGKALSANISLTAANVNAIPTGDVKAIKVLTQDAYNDLTSKSSTTLYIIKEE